MQLPDPMSRILVVGTKDRLPATIDLLYRLENVHIVDFSPEEEGFTLGTPLPAASDASHKLLKLRAAGKDLDIDESDYKERVPVKKVESDLDSTLADLESDIQMVVETKNSKQTLMAEADARIKALEPFKSIPLDLELYHGYQNLEVFSGHVLTDPEDEVRKSIDSYEMFKDKDGTFVVLFVPIDKADEAQRILVQSGFSEAPLPEGKGRPSEIITELEAQKVDLEKQLEEVTQRLEKLREKHAVVILASEEYLSNQVEKAELPLRMGETEHSFVMEAWVPTKDYESISKAFNEQFQDDIYVELLESMGRKEEHTEGGEAMEAGVLTAEAITKPISEETPTRLHHKRYVGRFEFFTKLIATPRYNEIDPTITIAIFFPFFFGFMVGDVAYGLAFAILGYIGLKRVESKEWKGIATMLFYGGIWSIFFGFFFFGDMLGMEFTALHGAGITPTWSELLGIAIPHQLFQVGGFPINLGYFNKIDDVKILLYMTIWIGIFHLLIGMLLGFYNVGMRHGWKHAFVEKFSWVMILVGGVFILVLLVGVLIQGQTLSFTDPLFIIGIILVVAGILVALKGEGGKAIIELPELLSNVLSYTRLAAIGLSKAGMALAFNYIAIVLIAPAGGAAIIAGILVFIVGHLMIFILAIISAGLHGIRLEYVEQFTKFFEGGGLDFNPLKAKRKHTMEE